VKRPKRKSPSGPAKVLLREDTFVPGWRPPHLDNEPICTLSHQGRPKLQRKIDLLIHRNKLSILHEELRKTEDPRYLVKALEYVQRYNLRVPQWLLERLLDGFEAPLLTGVNLDKAFGYTPRKFAKTETLLKQEYLGAMVAEAEDAGLGHKEASYLVQFDAFHSGLGKYDTETLARYAKDRGGEREGYFRILLLEARKHWLRGHPEPKCEYPDMCNDCLLVRRIKSKLGDKEFRAKCLRRRMEAIGESARRAADDQIGFVRQITIKALAGALEGSVSE